jgi:hypothetical protein
MANEISLNASLSTVKDGETIGGSCSKSLTQTGDEALKQIGIVALTADAELDLSVLGDVGQLLVKNLDATNFISVSTGTGGAFAAAVFGKIRAGCCMVIQPTRTLYYQADTADCQVAYTAIET